MRITADTNVLVSATFWAGDSFKIIEMAERGDIELILSKDIIGEFTRVLNSREIQDKIRNKRLEMSHTVQQLIAMAFIVEPRERIKAVKDDPDDDKILECAVEGKVNFIISRDNHLLKLKMFCGIPIVTPEEFLKVIF
ncbi:MAG: putative toxin-antitoxin system toxin component, PIN family [Nanoarchaeota archaeon]|nr:putative toxin-antitoxin system toxin component, PIN family [Nanoarchaeota archaeon]